jgi:pyrroloquinoline quinone biosynthesis protein E
MIAAKQRMYARLGVRMLPRFRWPIWRNAWRYWRHVDRARRLGPDELPFTPPNAIIWVTNRCNKDCDFCQYIDGLNARNYRELELSFERFRELLDLPIVRNCLRLGLYGGEPLLNRELPRMIAYGKKRGHMVTVNTNGLLVKKRCAELLESAPDLVSISYYPEDRTKTEEAVALLAPRLPVILKYMYSEARLGALEEVVACAAANGVWAVQFESYDPQGFEQDCELPAADAEGGVSRQNRELPLPPGDHRLARIRHDLRVRYGRKVLMFWPQSAAADGPSVRAGCRTFWHSTWLDARGQMLPCCVWPIAAFAGDVFDGTASWNSPRMVRLRAAMRNGRYARICSTCSHLYDDQLGV